MIVKLRRRPALLAAAGMALFLGGAVNAHAAGVTLTVWHNTQDTPGVRRPHRRSDTRLETCV